MGDKQTTMMLLPVLVRLQAGCLRAGRAVTRMEYMPYGDTWFTEGDNNNSPKYNSQELDKESNLYYYNARHYDAGVARFVTADTVIDGEFDTQGWNRYAYCHNNPIRYKDPSGHGILEFLSSIIETNVGSDDMMKKEKASGDGVAKKAVEDKAQKAEKDRTTSGLPGNNVKNATETALKEEKKLCDTVKEMHPICNPPIPTPESTKKVDITDSRYEQAKDAIKTKAKETMGNIDYVRDKIPVKINESVIEKPKPGDAFYESNKKANEKENEKQKDPKNPYRKPEGIEINIGVPKKF